MVRRSGYGAPAPTLGWEREGPVLRGTPSGHIALVRRGAGWGDIPERLDLEGCGSNERFRSP